MLLERPACTPVDRSREEGGEAERQLRLLFEEAKEVQPSIIFFDEIYVKFYHL